MDPRSEFPPSASSLPLLPLGRREFLRQQASGLAALALANLWREDEGETLPHHRPRAKRVVYLMQTGGPSHVDLFDDKPLLRERAGEALPDEVRKGQRLTTMTAGQAKFSLLPSFRPFESYGQSGQRLSTLLSHTGQVADHLCVVRSMFTEAINHAPAVTLLLTGHQIPGRPSLGAWLGYGLGRSSQDLPDFVVMTSRDRENSCGQLLYDHYWGSGFLPAHLQGVPLRGGADPVLFVRDPPGVDPARRRRLLDDLVALNAEASAVEGDPEIDARTTQYELAYRMQTSVPEVTDLSGESRSVLESYGPDVERPGSFARNCLLARRLLERGVRFVQLMHAGWDQHNNIPTQLEIQCRDTDQPSAALVADLHQRGLLEDTLVIWGGEFGRTPFCQGDQSAARYGRDHHGNAFSIWLAGGGVRAGHSFGASDPYGYDVVDKSGQPIRPTARTPHEDAVHPHDLQATILHLLGLDHEKLTFRYQGRKFRLTDVDGRVVRELLG